MQEGPTTAVVLYADIRSEGYNGNIVYKFLDSAPADIVTGGDLEDQMYNAWTEIDTTKTKGVGVYAYGVRNSFGLAVGLAGNVMLSDNGPNAGFGPEMTGYDPATMTGIHDANGAGPNADDGMWLDVQEVSCTQPHDWQ